MGWKENGKYGVSTGRTVRSPFANAGGPFSCSVSRRETEYLLKFTRGTEKLSTSELDEFLSANDIDDGLGDFAESSMRLRTAESNVHLSSISYSLKKRKRWRLPDLDRTGLELKDSADRPNVTFIHRRVEKALDADCFAIEKTKENEVFTPRKRKYTRVQDLLKRCDAGEVEPEVGYEISYRYPANEYPECGEGDGHRYRWSFQWSLSNPRKSRFKNKGVKNKGYRWDIYSDSDIRKKKIAHEEPCRCEVISYKANVESNVEMMDAELFRELKTSEERFCSSGATDFDLGCYIEEQCKHKRNHPNCKKTNQRLSAACNNQDQSIKNSFKYGKKSAIYNDLKPASIDLSQNQAIANSSPSAELEPQVFQPKKKAAVTLLLNADEVKPGNLKAEWNDLYTEANSLPRKFTIDLMPLFPTDHSITSESYCLLFEVTKKNRNGLSAAHVTTDVSLHCTKTEDFNANGNSWDANAKFRSEIEGASQHVWQVSNVVDCAVFWLQNCFQSPQYPTCRYNARKQGKTWKSVEALGDMFGWRSEICTQRQIKSELKMKIKEQSLHCLKDKIHTCPEMVGLSGEILDMFCGICYKELDACNETALKDCHHVFCNECWEIHLKMQISLGSTDLKCPEYKCNVCIDDVTILALVPSWYNKFLVQKIDKALDTSPKLRWCPSTKCGRVLKVAVSGAIANLRTSPMPVACECGKVWCFQCGRQAHWPASCSADEKFHEVTKRFLDELELNEDELITSVMVRNCPHCHYPIEKHLGCNFMYCIMCQTSFCWECLMPMSKHKDGCQRHEQSKEVELELASSSANRFARYFSVYCKSKKGRSSIALSHQIQRLRTVEKSIAYYKSICSSHGYSDQVIENVLQSGCTEILRSAAEFTYYAHLTLEGAAKMAIVSKSTCRSLKQDMERLQFIMEKVEELAKCDITQLLRQKCLSKLAAFLNCGKNCVFTIGQVLASRH